MEPRNMSDSDLVSSVKNLVSKERELTSEILKYLCEIETRRLYLDRGYSSMFSFCTEYLNYDESQAQRRISASRLIREIPELESKVEAGSLSITNLSMAKSFFNSMS